MPDISMCKNEQCLQKEKCYRYTATPSEFWQSWFGEDVRNEDGSCKYFWDNFNNL